MLNRFPKSIVILVSVICLSFSFSKLVSAAEIITSFNANIKISKNGDLHVTESISVIAEGRHIKRGIYRDFPRLIDINGVTKSVGFDIVSVKREGFEEPYHTEYSRNFTRIYIGDSEVYLSPGPHTYEITYITDRQLRFFPDHDELFWNVTGTEWVFPISAASANITLPNNIIATGTGYFTGPYGDKSKNAEAFEFENGNQIEFSTTAPLGAREGLSIVVSVPKGSFQQFPADKEMTWFWRDFGGIFAALLVLAISLIYYLVQWVRMGRDPTPGIITPRWEASKPLTPALTNYIVEKGNSSSHTGMIAAFLNLAVKGYVTIEGLNKKPTIQRTEKALGGSIREPLGYGELLLVDTLDERNNKSIKLSKTHGSSVAAMSKAFKAEMDREHDDIYHKSNAGSKAFGLIIGIIGLFTIALFGGILDGTFPSLIGMCMLTGLITLLVGITLYMINIETDSFAIAIVIVAGLIFVFGLGDKYIPGMENFESWFAQPYLLLILFVIVMVHIKFMFLLSAPTNKGREKMDEIEGLKTYLELAEKDRMNLAGAPKMSPQHFEKLLPYAVAMGVEEPWSNSFQSWLAAAAAVGAGAAANHYSPGWYRGRFRTDRINKDLGGISNSMSSSFTASLPTPKSSSSGSSGGSSGGGGGGGGGGGW